MLIRGIRCNLGDKIKYHTLMGKYVYMIMLFVLPDGTIPSSLSKLTKLQKCYLYSNNLSICASVWVHVWGSCVCVCVCEQRTGKGRKACQKRVIGQCGILQPTPPSLCCRGVVPSKADPQASHMAESVTATGSAGA